MGGRLLEAGRLLTFPAFRMGAYSRWALANKYGILQNVQRPKEDEWTLERLDFGIEWVKFHYKGKTKREHDSFLFPCRSVNFRINSLNSNLSAHEIKLLSSHDNEILSRKIFYLSVWYWSPIYTAENFCTARMKKVRVPKKLVRHG